LFDNNSGEGSVQSLSLFKPIPMNIPEALIVFSNDWHLKKENIDEITDLVRQQCILAKELNAKYLACLGDIFDSRVAQRQEVLDAFSEILDMIKEYDIELWAIPGNHDKTVYTSYKSFLTAYKYHPNFKLIIIAGSLPFVKEGISLHFLPFFKEEMWVEEYNAFAGYIGNMDEAKHILCTHIAVTGSRNNDGTMVTSTLSSKLFKDFYKVFSGHYHDQQKIGENFYHLPSIQQNNFGENSDKGFTVLYSDGSHQLFRSKFKEFIKVKIDLEQLEDGELTLLAKKYQNSSDNIRFEITGPENSLKSLCKEDFTSIGIDIKTKCKEIEDDIIFAESEDIKEHTKDSIKEEFSEFCVKENLNHAQGFKYLIKKLN